MSALQAFRKQHLTDDEYYRGLMQGSFMIFVQTFFPIMTGRPFQLAQSAGREPYQLTMARELRASYDGKLVDANHKPCQHILINIPPRYGKTTLMHYFAAWCFANNPECNFIYASYEQTLAALQTLRIREIVTHPEFQRYFDLRLSGVSKAKDYFETEQNGSMFAVGCGGPITGRGCGIRDGEVFGGAFIWDDLIKPNDVMSDTRREAAVDWIYNTAQSRLNNPSKTPIWAIGQMLHESDPYAHLRTRDDFKKVVIAAIDSAGNALDPSIHTIEQLKEMQRLQPYVFAAQYMQNPQPAGGGIFKPEWFVIHDFEPHIIKTFITIDTAETDKTYNDATVFSLWGLYKIKIGITDTGLYGLHWIDCRELRVEPKDLQSQFYSFYMECLREINKPEMCAIEKKSTGTTMISVLREMQGLRIMEVERFKQKNRAYTKIDRFLECQSYLAARRISFTRGDMHIEKCIDQCRKITANNTHAFDDIADTMQMAIQCALIEGILLPKVEDPTNTIDILSKDFAAQQNIQRQAMQWNY